MSRLSKVIPVAAGAVAGGLVALAIAGGGGSSTKTVTTVVSQRVSSSALPATSSAIPTSLSKGQSLTVNQIYRKDSPGVVDIIETSQSSSGTSLFGGGGTQETQGEGAGVVYDTKGDILTDEHVVANAISVKVTFQDGYTAAAKVLGTDPSTDVAVIRVNAPASQLHPIVFANSSNVQVGDPVVAIGSPFSLPETTTAGIVSAIGRDITAPNNYTITGAIQTDAAINPGNSGGPLLDAQGQVLGLNDQIQTESGSSAGVGFATPSSTDVQIAQGIIAGHPLKHSYVGVCLNPTASGGAQIATQSDRSCNAPVAAGSPAAKADLRPGDVITSIDGAPVTSTEDFITKIGDYSPGTTVTFTIKRAGKTLHVKVTLGARPATAPTS
jgi:putative serine protease PepD